MAVAVVEDRIDVTALAGQDVPVVETLRLGAEVPLAEHRRVVAGLLETVGDGDRRWIEVVEDGDAVLVAVLAGEDGGPAGRADGVHRVTTAEAQALGGEAVHVRCRVDRAAVRADGVGRVVVRHDEQDVRSLGRGLGRKDEPDQGADTEQDAEEHGPVFNASGSGRPEPK